MVFGTVSLVWHACGRIVDAISPLRSPEEDATAVKVSNGLVTLFPLWSKYRSFPRAAQVRDSMIDVVGMPCMRLSRLFVILAREGGKQCMALLASLACWCCFHMERHPFTVEADADPLHMVIPRGAKRSRRVPQAFKAAVSAEAAKGHLGRSEHRVASVLTRLCPMARSLCSKKANAWMPEDAGRWFRVAQSYFTSTDWRFLHVQGDAARLGGKDTWFAAVRIGGQCGAWALPKAASETVRVIHSCGSVV